MILKSTASEHTPWEEIDLAASECDNEYVDSFPDTEGVLFLNDFVVMSINKQHQQQLQNLKQFRQQQYEYIIYIGSTKGSPRRRPGRSS